MHDLKTDGLEASQRLLRSMCHPEQKTMTPFSLWNHLPITLHTYIEGEADLLKAGGGKRVSK